MVDVKRLSEYAENMSILIVEDNKKLRTQLHTFLSKIFPNIDAVENGLDGLKIFREKWHDIILTDIKMPQMNGIDMIKDIKNQDWDQRVIVYSAFNTSENLSEMINLNISHFIHKPASYNDMLDVIYSVVKTLYISRKQMRLEQEMEEKSAIKDIMFDLIENGIVVIEEWKIVDANQRFLDIVGLSGIDELRKSNIELDSFFEHKDGFLFGFNNQKFIEKLINNREKEYEVAIKDGDGKSKVYEIECSRFPYKDTYIISFTNVTSYESDKCALIEEMHTNQFTGLPNKIDILEKIRNIQLQNRTVNLILFSIKNFDHIVTWHGKEAGLKLEKHISNQIKQGLEKSAIGEKIYLGNFDKNRFIFIADKELMEKTEKFLHFIELSVCHTDCEDYHKYETIQLVKASKFIELSPTDSNEEVVKIIENSFDDMIL